MVVLIRPNVTLIWEVRTGLLNCNRGISLVFSPFIVMF
jgi:hypothetical protein